MLQLKRRTSTKAGRQIQNVRAQNVRAYELEKERSSNCETNSGAFGNPNDNSSLHNVSAMGIQRTKREV